MLLVINSSPSLPIFFDSLYVVGISTSGDSYIGLPSNSTGPSADAVILFDAIGISLLPAGALKRSTAPEIPLKAGVF